MPFSRPTLQEIVDRMISDIKSRITNAGSFLRRSVFMVLARVYAGAVHLLYSFLDYMKNQMFATTADSDYLEIIANEYGISRLAGSQAVGKATVTGTAGLVVSSGTQFQSSSGNIYTADDNTTIGITGSLVIDITAYDIGDSYNDDGGISLSFVSPIAGINTSILVDSNGLTGGADEETDDSLRQRVLIRKRNPPHAGADFDYVSWMKEYTGVTRAWCIPEYQGAGTIGICFVMDNQANIFPTESVKTLVMSYLESHVDPITNLDVGLPVTAKPGLFWIPLQPLTCNFTIKVYPNNSTVQDSVIARLEELLLTSGEPGNKIALSQIYEAIVNAIGEEKSNIVFPTSDISAAVNQLPVMGTVTFQDYT